MTPSANPGPATRRGVTEQVAVAAIDSGTRLLRLPTIHDRFAEIAAAAERGQLSYLGFLAELVMAEFDDRYRRRAAKPHPRRRLPPRQAPGGVLLRRQLLGQPGGDQPARDLRLSQGRTPSVPDRRLRHRHHTC